MAAPHRPEAVEEPMGRRVRTATDVPLHATPRVLGIGMRGELRGECYPASARTKFTKGVLCGGCSALCSKRKGEAKEGRVPNVLNEESFDRSVPESLYRL